MAEHLIERMTWQEVEAASGVVGAVVPRIVQVCRETAGKG
jgi:hypothetical protein